MPEMFGIMAIVNVLVTGVQMFSDIGLGPSIIQSKRGEEADFINTAWTLQILRGFAIWLFVSVVAVGLWFANRYGYINQDQVYGHPLLPWLLVVVGSSSVISGFNSTAIFVSNRTLALGRITVINLLSQVIGLCAIIYFAWLKQSIWALAVGTIVTSLVYMVLSHKFLPGAVNKLCWDKTAVKDLIKFGKWIFLTTAIGFVANQGDRLLLGSYLTPEMLGVYSIAFMLSNLPASIVSALSHKVIFPSASRIYRDHPERLKETFVKSKKWLALFFMSLTGILIGLSQNIIDLLYDERYSDAGWMMEILLLRVATSCMLIPNSIVMMAKGLPIFSTISAVLKAFFIFVTLPLSFHHFGVKGMIIMIGISGLIDAPVLWYALIKHKLFSLSVELYSLILLFCGYALGWLISNFDSLDLFIMSNKLYKQLIQYL